MVNYIKQRTRSLSVDFMLQHKAALIIRANKLTSVTTDFETNLFKYSGKGITNQHLTILKFPIQIIQIQGRK